MIRPAALVAHQRGEPMPVELRDQRRRQLVGNEDERAFEFAEQVGLHFSGAQVAEQPSDDVGDVAAPFAQIRIVGAVEERRDFVERLLQRRFGIDA